MRKLVPRIAFAAFAAIAAFVLAGSAAWALRDHSLGDLAAELALVVEHGSATRGQLGSGGFNGGGANGGGAPRGSANRESVARESPAPREAGTIP